MDKNNQAFKLWLSTDFSMEVKNPIWDELKQKRDTLQLQYEMNKKAKLPSWMNEKTCLTVLKLEEERERIKNKKSFFKRIIHFFK